MANLNIERNNFLYGELNTLVKKNTYRGALTNTAITTVDNANNLIYVDVTLPEARDAIDTVLERAQKLEDKIIELENRVKELEEK